MRFTYAQFRFSLYTMMYLVAVLAPEPVYSAVWAMKQDVHAQTGSRNAVRLPPHITLLPPWHQPPEQEENLISCLQSQALQLPVFTAEVQDFAWFGTRTLFVRVLPHPQWPILQQELEVQCAAWLPKAVNKQRPFTPHMTLATRDLPARLVPQLKQQYAQQHFQASFPVENMTLFRHDGQQWQPIHTFPFRGGGASESA
ncbi:2'-5' RNA ligase family protein [Hymenobacter sp. BT730]|uniref:2'-5' RNA ligase family protein n=1 Tax=Hymenobacter sp. BT730 TaxID=3063332 RepID=UPI0026DF0FB0|nr:2'-5' RNA ligase family protein [Hymenobacter sp. BT730]